MNSETTTICTSCDSSINDVKIPRRKIAHIDEEKCNGCGLRIPNCAEGVLKIVDGKARLVSETFCDGLGACVGRRPQGAITIIKREAEGFEEAVKGRVASRDEGGVPKRHKVISAACPSSRVLTFKNETATPTPPDTATVKSELRQWPARPPLVPPKAPYFQANDPGSNPDVRTEIPTRNTFIPKQNVVHM